MSGVAGAAVLRRPGVDEQGGPRPTGTRRWAARALAVVALLVVGVLGSSGPTGDAAYDPRSTGPGGLRGVVDLLRELDVEVDVGDADDTDAGTVLVLFDATPDEVAALARPGRRLVSTVPPSADTELSTIGIDGLGLVEVPVACPLLPDVGALVAASWVGWATPGGAPEPGRGDRCGAVGDGWWLVRTADGPGEHLHLTSLAPLVNARLDDTPDAAVAALRLLAPGGDEQVLLLEQAGAGPATLGDLVPLRVWHALLLGTLAVLLLAAARGRRLGAPQDERLPVRVPGGELVRALGDLRTRAGHTGASHAALRRHTLDALRRAHRLPPGAGADEVLAAHRAAGLPVGPEAAAALGTTPPPDDATLARAAAALAALRAAVRPDGGEAAPRGTVADDPAPTDDPTTDPTTDPIPDQRSPG